MSEKVPVFDPKSKDLRRLPLREINGPPFSPFPAILILEVDANNDSRI